MTKEELKDELAYIQHEIWGSWQKYLHSKCTINSDGSLTIPSGLVERWERQINSTYNELSDKEQSSDMEQVDKFIDIIYKYCELGRKDEREELIDALTNMKESYINLNCKDNEGIVFTNLSTTVIEDIINIIKQRDGRDN